MKILLLNGNPAAGDTAFEAYIDEFTSRLIDIGHTAEIVQLRGKNIKPCTGCFGCWIKTPGECIINDDGKNLAERYMASDLIVFSSPLINGYFSGLLKNAIDRSIPVMHPHLEEVDGEVHHLKRYDRYPLIGIILQREASTDAEDIEIAEELFERMCINMRTSLNFINYMDKPAKEAADAVNIH